MYVGGSDVRPAGGQQRSPAGIYPVCEAFETRRIYAHAIFGLCPALGQQGKRRSTYWPGKGFFAPGWGGAHYHYYRQAVRADECILGKNTQTPGKSAMSVATFLRFWFTLLLYRQCFRQGYSVSDPSLRASRNKNDKELGGGGWNGRRAKPDWSSARHLRRVVLSTVQ